jgi:endonuclease/exonuclease/phosphatase family metal-dependent hydrolase
MTTLRAGTYRGSADGMSFEFRVEDRSGAAASGQVILSGDVLRDGAFVASFVCRTLEESSGGELSGPLAFRGNPGLFTGHVKLAADERGIGVFEVAVDLEGGHRDICAGRLDWAGSYLRRIHLEIDGIEGTQPPPVYVGANGRRVSIASALEAAGCDVTVSVDPFRGRGPDAVRQRGFTPAEIHAAMQRIRGAALPADRLHVHVFVCSYLAGRNGKNVLGMMYDFGDADANRRPREGVAIFYDHGALSDPRVPSDARAREYVFTAVHEIGHALNLLHSFDKGRPSALSWMNYPDYYPFGRERPTAHNGATEFWRQFPERFDPDELQHLRHGSPREVAAGGFAFGTYEEGPSVLFGGTADPRRTALGANPLRAISDVEFKVGALKPEYALGEPVFLRIEARNVGSQLRFLPDALDPSEGFVKLTIRRPDGRVVRYRPPVRFCTQAQLLAARAGSTSMVFDGAPIFMSSDGPIFSEPGTYVIRADLTGVDGSRVVSAAPTTLRVAIPDRETERFAERSWDERSGLTALFLRHPLAEREAWQTLEELAREHGLDRRADNTTWAYLNYVAALGWLTPFAEYRTRAERQPNMAKAAARMHAVDPRGLPASVARRQEAVLRPGAGTSAADRDTSVRAKRQAGGRSGTTAAGTGGSASAADAPMHAAGGEDTGGAPHDGGARAAAPEWATRYAPLYLRPEDRARAGVPPSGLFGYLGIGAPTPDDGASADPFARIVPSLRGTTAFADVVSWNIEHLHAQGNWKKIPHIADLIRSFRCDVWGLQEVDGGSLAELVNTINSVGKTRYGFEVVPGSGQQSGLLYRTDTTRVDVLEVPDWMMSATVTVEVKHEGKKKRRVFLRAPLLADVRVSQSGGVFDFRCAVVHLKSTDTQLVDTGNAMRAAAARLLARWIEEDRAAAGERDYLIMGDMNAETPEQGLKAFAGAGLSLLSVGMRDRYGQQALTRVASGRFLDHIVITSDSTAYLPEEDEDEQIVIRSDTTLADFTEEYSDHVPVAVRFVLGNDADDLARRLPGSGAQSGASGSATPEALRADAAELLRAAAERLALAERLTEASADASVDASRLLPHPARARRDAERAPELVAELVADLEDALAGGARVAGASTRDRVLGVLRRVYNREDVDGPKLKDLGEFNSETQAEMAHEINAEWPELNPKFRSADVSKSDTADTLTTKVRNLMP